MTKVKTHTFITILVMAILLLGVGVIQEKAGPAFAEETIPVLDVYYDDQILKSFTKAEVEDLAAAENGGTPKEYAFSGLNTNLHPSYEEVEQIQGATVEGILNLSLKNAGEGLPKSVDEIAGDQVIEIKEHSEDEPYRAVFTKEQLFCDRYYYPKVTAEINWYGEAVPETSPLYEGREKVPPVITTNEKKGGRLLCGQIVPSEQNKPEWVQNMIKDPPRTVSDPITETSWRSCIIIRSGQAPQWNALEETSPKAGTIFTGDEITFRRGVNEYQQKGSRYWIYYTTDGSEPTLASTQYNYNNNGHEDDDFSVIEKMNRPKPMEAGEYVIKAKVIGDGKRDSEVTEFRYQVKNPIDLKITGRTGTVVYNGKPHTLSGFEWSSDHNDLVDVTLKKPAAITATNPGKYAGGLDRNSFEITVNNEAYAIRNVSVKDLQLTVIPPTLSKPVIKKITVKNKTATLKWNRVKGASGYRIYRSTKKKSGYKLVKTISKGSTVSWKNKNLKKKKTYYYKIRAFCKIPGRTIYSSYSAVKYKKVK